MKYISSIFFSFFILICFCPFSINANSHDNNRSPVKHFEKVIQQIKQLYVNSVEDEKLFADAINGILSNLDPYSVYLDQEALRAFDKHTEGRFVGLGMKIAEERGLIKIVSLIEVSPAQLAGIKVGDYILSSDGKSLTGVPVSKVINILRGPRGSKLILKLLDHKTKKKYEVVITRKLVKLTSVISRLLVKNFGYIRISCFQQYTGDKFIKAVKNLYYLSHNHLNGVIIDLRNNPGGMLSAAIKVADSLLDSGKLGKNTRIVYTKGRSDNSSITKRATPGDILNNVPLIVLINHNSASAAEMIAGALQDHKRAIIMGEKSYGKGSVQTVFPLGNNTAIKLTTALYYTPKGRQIHGKGIRPDILVQALKLQHVKEQVFLKWQANQRGKKKYLRDGSNILQSQSKHDQNNLMKIASNDYQLYEAFKLLKSLVIIQSIRK